MEPHATVKWQVGGRKVEDLIRLLVNFRELYGSETLLWRKKEKFMIKVSRLINLRSSLGINWINKIKK